MSGYLKAIVAALIAGLGTLSAGLADNGLTAQEIVTAIVAFLVALGGVYTAPNKP